MTLKAHQSPSGGLNDKGRAYYNRKNNSNLKAPTTSKTSGRRKSFCARMSGVRGRMTDEKGRPTRKALALKKWDC
jgi:hypothetical protein|tara:strand:+ start:114 stop:338 length:225 start_codon:yes stop_codon:yes gene_type:complete